MQGDSIDALGMSVINLTYLLLGFCVINRNFLATCYDIETIGLVAKHHPVNVVSREAVHCLALSAERRALVH